MTQPLSQEAIIAALMERPAVDVLVELHAITPRDGEHVHAIKAAIEFCLEQPAADKQEVMAAVVERLVAQQPWSMFLMRFVIITCHKHPPLRRYAIDVVRRMLVRKVWTDGYNWKGFQIFCESLMPNTVPLVCALPDAPLREAAAHMPAFVTFMRRMALTDPEQVSPRVMELIEGLPPRPEITFFVLGPDPMRGWGMLHAADMREQLGGPPVALLQGQGAAAATTAPSWAGYVREDGHAAGLPLNTYGGRVLVEMGLATIPVAFHGDMVLCRIDAQGQALSLTPADVRYARETRRRVDLRWYAVPPGATAEERQAREQAGDTL